MNAISKTKNYLTDVKAEVKKVSWPDRKKTIKDSAVVVAASLATAAFLGGVDYLLSYLIDKFIIK